jgi:DNA-binding transcriptional MerR regulator
MSLSITDVARHAGVPTSTLRYYDRLGLLESAGRGDNGYRQYDERALDRLQFIARAKELGCSLDEIATLLTAFDQDCADVQGTLRDLVDGKIAIAQRRVAELVALTAQLQEARHALTAEAGEGPCGPGCVCVGKAPRTGRSLTVVQLAEAEPAIACTLSHEEMGDRMHNWQTALANVDARAPIEDGIRLTFRPEADLAEITRLARAEWACCSFFSFSITVDGRGTALEVRAPEAARELVASVFGVAA